MTEEFVFSLIGSITGVIGMVFGILSIIRSRHDSVNNYFSIMESQEFSDARHFVYNNPLSLDDEIAAKNASRVVNFFHHWGLLTKKGYLPIWVFDSGSGVGTIRMFELTWDYIKAIRKKQRDKTYAEYFIWLYLNIRKRKGLKQDDSIIVLEPENW